MGTMVEMRGRNVQPGVYEVIDLKGYVGSCVVPEGDPRNRRHVQGLSAVTIQRLV